jgi:hypothetical protein
VGCRKQAKWLEKVLAEEHKRDKKHPDPNRTAGLAFAAARKRAENRLSVSRPRDREGRAWAQRGASIMPTKGRIEWPYVTLLIAIVLMVAVALHLLSTWVALVIVAVLWIGFAIWPNTHR